MPVTRLGLDGYGVRRAGSFSGKTAATTHPVGLLTRLGAEGYGVRRYRTAAFAGKTAEGAMPAEGEFIITIARRRRGR